MKLRGLVPLVALLIVLLGACGGSSGGSVEAPPPTADAAPTATPNEISTPRPNPSIVPTAPAAPTAQPTIEPAPPSGRRSAPRSLEDGDLTLTVNGATWTVSILGMVDGPITGNCLIVYGLLTPEDIPGRVVSSPANNPDFVRHSGDTPRGANGYSCDTRALDAAGYRSVDFAASVVGTPLPFYVGFDVGPDTPIEAVGVGSSLNNQYVWFVPSVTESIIEVPPITSTAALIELEPMAEATVRFVKYEATWDIADVGLAAVEDTSDGDGDGVTPGTCFVLFGNATLSNLSQGLVAGDTSFPWVELIADGQVVGTPGPGCDISAYIEAGYASIFGAQVTEGTVYRFVDTFRVPEGATPEAAVLGGLFGETPVYLSADVSEDPNLSEPAAAPGGSLPLRPFSEAVWDADGATGAIIGITDMGPNSYFNAPHRCIAVFGTASVERDLRHSGSNIGLIAEGRYYRAGTNSDACDVADIEAAGYTVEGSAFFEVSDGSRQDFYAVAAVPSDAVIEAIVIGQKTSDQAIAYAAEFTGIIAPPPREPEPDPEPTPEPVPEVEPYLQEPTLVTSADLDSTRVANQFAVLEYFEQLQELGESNVQECMRLADFEYFPRQFAGASGQLPESADRDMVALQGFGLVAPLVTGIAIQPMDNSRNNDSGYRRTLSPDALARYENRLGTEATPAQAATGCFGAALTDVYRFTEVTDGLRSEIIAAQRSFLTDPRIVELDEQWPSCMEQAGYDFALRARAVNSIREKFRAIVNAPGRERAVDVTTGIEAPVTPEDYDLFEVLIDEERAVALATFDCEAETAAERRAVETEYNEQFFAAHGGVIDQILADF